jgi:2-polyprenyl-3-methyl-5-hydroxy-6-metoxy-1,4-benzoquinol methylase
VKAAEKPYYRYSDGNLNNSHEFLMPRVLRELALLGGTRPMRAFDLGCGNGSVARELVASGWDVTGVDPSEEGVTLAKLSAPLARLHLGSAYDDLSSVYGRFPVVLSLEVVEHLYFPRKWAATVFDLLEPKGVAVISTPYHGYFKNLALALTGKLDAHFTALWDHGHIKFWSEKTLRTLLIEAGFEDVRFGRVGRIYPVAKSMIAVAQRP